MNRYTGTTTTFILADPLWAARDGTTTAGTLPDTWVTEPAGSAPRSRLDQDRFSATPDRLVVRATDIDPAKATSSG